MNTKTLIAILGAASLLSIRPAVAANYVGFGESYAVQVGDLNGDGLKDIHLVYRPHVALIGLDDMTIPIAGHASPVGDFVLQQTSSGGFTIVSNLSAAQKAAVATWPIVSGIKIQVHDYNVDGLADVLVSKVSSTIPGAQDVFVFAPKSEGAPPTVAKSWDMGKGTSLDWFVRDILGWLTNPQHYYDPGLYYSCQPALVWVPVQQTDAAGNTYIDFQLEQVTVCGNWLNPATYSIDALNFNWNFWAPLVYAALPPKVQQAINISQLFTKQFGISLMNGTLESGAQDFGLSTDLQAVLTSCQSVDSNQCYAFFDGLRLMKLLLALRMMAVNGFCDLFDPPAHHDYLLPASSEQVCGASSNGCNPDHLYTGEMLVHPATGYWQRSHSQPFKDGDQGYAEMGCNRDIPNACDPIYGLGSFGAISAYPTTPNYDHINATRPGHIFHPGWIERTVVPVSGGLAIQTHGWGDGACPILNELAGPRIFRVLDQFIACHLAGGCHPVP
jgi:hypothetical protein